MCLLGGSGGMPPRKILNSSNCNLGQDCCCLIPVTITTLNFKISGRGGIVVETLLT